MSIRMSSILRFFSSSLRFWKVAGAALSEGSVPNSNKMVLVGSTLELFDMVSTPSGERERTVPWNEIVAVALFDLPAFKDGELRVYAFEDDADVDVADAIVVMHGLGSDLDASNK